MSREQILPAKQWELLLVDNASDRPLAKTEPIPSISLSRSRIAGFSRTEKVAYIATNRTAFKVLKVCWEGKEPRKNLRCL
jgi:hypothetical protein